MMKKNLKDYNVVRAMALGIAAVMALGEPMTVFAEEPGEPNTGAGNNVGNNSAEESVVKKAQEAADDVDGAVAKADASAETIKKDIEDNVNATDTTGMEAYEVREETKDDAELSTKGDAGSQTAPTEIDSAMTDVDTQLSNAEAADIVAEKNLADAQEAADDASQAADDASQVVDAAQAEAAEDLANIENAATEEEANAAYAEMEAAVEQAQKDFDEKVADYNAAKAAYETAASNAEAAKQAYDNAVSQADQDAAAAEAALNAAKTEADELAAKVAAAKEAVDSASAAAMDIAAKEKLTQEDEGLNWRNEDKLFESIMKNYYLPEKFGILEATVTRKQGPDNNEYNYFEVVYEKDGQQVTEYYNFKMDNNNTDTDKIVIFEKREVEVNGDPSVNADQYVDGDGNKWIVNEEAGNAGDKTLDAALKDGSVVAVDGTYYEKNEKTGEETLIENSTVTGTSTKDVSVSGTKKETFKEALDEQGNVTGLVKEITSDVTTITYTEKTFNSDTDYNTEAERDAAAEEKKAELEAATGKDATIVKTSDTESKDTFVAEGTYVPVFEKTIEINKTAHNWSKSEAIDEVKGEIADDTEEKLEGYHIIEQTFDVTAEKVKDNTLQNEYRVTGSSSVTYAKTTKTKIDFSIWQGLGNVFTNELKQTAEKWVKDQGGIYVGSKWIDMNVETAEVTYVAAQTITGKEALSEEAAMASLQAAIQAALDALTAPKGGEAVKYKDEVDVEVEKGSTEVTTYSYDVNYLEKSGESTENKVIATESYANAEALTGEIIQNLNYINGEILLDQDDAGYRNFVDSAKELTSKYERLLEEAKTAQDDVKSAQDAVDALQEELEALKNEGADMNLLEELEQQLAAAEAKLGAAEDKMGGLHGQLEEAAGVLEEVVGALNSATGNEGTPEGGTNADGGTTGDEETPEEEEEEEEEEEIVVIEEELAPLAAPAQGGDAQVIVPEQQPPVPQEEPAPQEETQEPTVVIEEEQVPLTDTAVTEDNSSDEEQKDTVTIEDEDVALASGAAKEKMSWWWLLIIALLGATGYEMYKKYQAKKEEAAK